MKPWLQLLYESLVESSHWCILMHLLYTILHHSYIRSLLSVLCTGLYSNALLYTCSLHDFFFLFFLLPPRVSSPARLPYITSRQLLYFPHSESFQERSASFHYPHFILWIFLHPPPYIYILISPLTLPLASSSFSQAPLDNYSTLGIKLTSCMFCTQNDVILFPNESWQVLNVKQDIKFW